PPPGSSLPSPHRFHRKFSRPEAQPIALFLGDELGVRFARRRTEHVGQPGGLPNPPSEGTEKMTRDPILFRVDGTSRTGHERLYRCMTYAAALQRRRRPCFFLSQIEPPPLAFSLRRAGNDRVEAQHPVGSSADLEQLLSEVRRSNPAAVVVDAAEADENYLREVRSACPVVVSIDHLATSVFPSRLIVNPLLGPVKEAYTFNRGAQLLLGARYALVRPEVRRARPIRSQEPPQPFRIMVALGDDDPNNRT